MVIILNVMELKEYIHESINSAKRQMLSETIKQIIANELNEAKGKKVKVGDLVNKLMKNDKFKKKALEYLTDDDAMLDFKNNLNGKKYSKLLNQSDGSKRRNIYSRLNDKKIDYAPIAYKLWPDMSEDSARSWFSKKVNGKNAKFSDDEVSKIYNILNNKL